MLKRIWRIIVAVITLGIVRLENQNAGAIRNQIIDEKVGQVAQARQGLGELAGAVRQQTREVSRLEGEQHTIQGRKDHYLGIVRASGPGSSEAADATQQARDYHRQLVGIVNDLNAARTELARLTNEYEISKGLVTQAQQDVQEAKKKGRRQDQRMKAARRREQLVRTTSSLRGVAGIGDDLVDLDEQIENEIDQLEGAAYVAADMASAELRERQLDAEIAQHQTDADFEAELAAMEADTSTVTVDVPALPEPDHSRDVPAVGDLDREPVPVRTSEAADFGSSDFGSSDFGGSDD